MNLFFVSYFLFTCLISFYFLPSSYSTELPCVLAFLLTPTQENLASAKSGGASAASASFSATAEDQAVLRRLWRDKWVRVRPALSPRLLALHRELDEALRAILAEYKRVVQVGT